MTDGSGKQLSIEIILGDCLEAMAGIPDGSVDAIICDLPYGGVTACAWDVLIPFEPLWEHYRRVIKPNGAVVLFGVQPFTSALVMSNPKWFRYEIVWDKVNPTGFLNAKKMPLRGHENILVFYGALPTYNPQKYRKKPGQARTGNGFTRRGVPLNDKGVYGDGLVNVSGYRSDLSYPKTLIQFPSGNGYAKRKNIHPTQKPVPLCEWLIRTYTNPCETVLDNTMGSASVGVACLQTGRNFIGIEKDETYFSLAKKRLADAQAQLTFTHGSGDESV